MNRKWIFLFISVTFIFSGVRAALVGSWNFNEGNGTVSADSSGNGNAATLLNGPSWVARGVGAALSFDGATSYADAGNNASLNATDGITMSAWIKPVNNGTGNYYSVLQKNASYEILIRSDGIVVMYLSGVNNYVTSLEKTNINLFDGIFHHIIATYNGTTQAIYIDNVLISSTTMAGHINPNTNATKIGVGFKGRIDDVLLYNHGLSAEEVHTLYLSYGLVRVQPQTYYLSSRTGNDNNDGLSEMTPWKNLDVIYQKQLMPGVILPGDQILLKRGDSWEGEITINQLGALGAARIRIASYGPLSDPKPIIYSDGRNLVWTAVAGSPGVYEASIGVGSDIEEVYENNTAYSRSTTPLSLTPGTWGRPEGQPNVLWIYTSDGNSPKSIRAFRHSAIKITNSTTLTIEDLDLREVGFGVFVQNSDSILIKGLDILNVQTQGILFETVSNSTMENNNVVDSINTTLYNRSGSHNIIRNNIVNRVHNGISGIIKGVADRAGIGLESSVGTLAEYNKVIDVPVGAFDYFYEVDSIVRYNYVEGSPAFYPHGSNNIVYGNIVNGKGQFAAFNLSSTGLLPNRIYNNTFYNIGGYGMMASRGGIIRNNIIYGNGAVDLADFTDTIVPVDSDHNCYYTSEPYSSTPHFTVNGVRYTGLAAFQSTGHDLHSVYGDPKLDVNFKIAADSPCRDMGADISQVIPFSNVDYVGVAIPQGAAPDIGAYEYVSSVPPITTNAAPELNAGADLTVVLPHSANLIGSITDDGLPNPPGILSILWTMITGPGQVTFLNQSKAQTTAAFSSAGVYVLRCMVSDGDKVVTDDITITVLPTSDKVTVSETGNGFTDFDTVFNPTQGETLNIHYTLASAQSVRLGLFSRSGEEIVELVNGDQSANSYAVSWNGLNRSQSKVASGTYILVLNLNGSIKKKKIVVVK